MKEELQFLKDLQEALKNQEVDGQAAPRYWALMDYRVVPANEKYDATDTSYFHNDGDHTEFKDTDELKEFLKDYYNEEDANEYLKSLVEDPDIDFESLWSYTISHLNEDGFFDECPVKEESFLVPNTMFLTKEEAKQHIKSNHYHYSSKVHTYALTAWRAPKVRRLLDILESFDWDSLLKE